MFWDINENTLDLEKDESFIIKKVLEFGTIHDWNKLKQLYSIEEIAQTAMNIRDLDKKSATFISALSNIQLNHFKCFSTEQSRPKHWIF
ncbi:MAG: hypothetical protein QXH80_02710 [Candidatus Nanoarchaeia archaeon]